MIRIVRRLALIVTLASILVFTGLLIVGTDVVSVGYAEGHQPDYGLHVNNHGTSGHYFKGYISY